MRIDGDVSSGPVEESPVPYAGPQAPANVRAVVRVGTEFFTRSIDSLAKFIGDDLIKALVYNAVWTANVKHITTSAANTEFGGMDALPPDDQRRPVSVLAVANSLRIPYETVRRTAQAMIKSGVCERVGNKGLIVPSRIHDQQNAREAVRSSLPSLLRFLADLKRAGFDFSPYRRPLPNTVPMPPDGAMPDNVRALLRVCSELLMRGIDTLSREHSDDFLTGLIFTTICFGNLVVL
jgi:hypothetical protein